MVSKIAQAIQTHAMPRAFPFETPELIHLARCDLERNRIGISRDRVIAICTKEDDISRGDASKKSGHYLL